LKKSLDAGRTMPGRFITVEGVEGAGKTTQIRLLAGWLRARGHRVRETAEPDGTRLGEAIRALFAAAPGPEPLAEAFLFAAARRQHVVEVIRPALAAGEIVLSDRFADATLAYQGYGRGVPLGAIETLNQLATERLRPDLTVLLDLDVATGLARLEARPLDPFEALGLDFHERVRKGYLELAGREPDRFVVIDAHRRPQEVQAAIREAVGRLLR